MSMRDYIMRFCAGLLLFTFFMILLRWFTVVVLIDSCKWDNELTRLVLWDNWRLPELIHPREKISPGPVSTPSRSRNRKKICWQNCDSRKTTCAWSSHGSHAGVKLFCRDIPALSKQAGAMTNS